MRVIEYNVDRGTISQISKDSEITVKAIHIHPRVGLVTYVTEYIGVRHHAVMCLGRQRSFFSSPLFSGAEAGFTDGYPLIEIDDRTDPRPPPRPALPRGSLSLPYYTRPEGIRIYPNYPSDGRFLPR